MKITHFCLAVGLLLPWFFQDRYIILIHIKHFSELCNPPNYKSFCYQIGLTIPSTVNHKKTVIFEILGQRQNRRYLKINYRHLNPLLLSVPKQNNYCPITTDSNKLNVIGAKRRKTHASESRLVLGLLLFGWKKGANFANQSQSVVLNHHRWR